MGLIDEKLVRLSEPDVIVLKSSVQDIMMNGLTVLRTQQTSTIFQL
jgi:hypothetical protein